MSLSVLGEYGKILLAFYTTASIRQPTPDNQQQTATTDSDTRLFKSTPDSQQSTAARKTLDQSKKTFILRPNSWTKSGFPPCYSQ